MLTGKRNSSAEKESVTPRGYRDRADHRKSPAPFRAGWRDDTHTFFTIGHSTERSSNSSICCGSPLSAFIIGVRSMPRSRTNPQFNQILPEALAPRQIGYEHIIELGRLRGKSQGAEASTNVLWRVRSFRNYADDALTVPFATGLSAASGMRRGNSGARSCAPKRSGGAATVESSPTTFWRQASR